MPFLKRSPGDPVNLAIPDGRMVPLTIFGENGEGVAHSDISIFPASEFPPPFPREVAFWDIAHRNVQNRHETANFREKEERGGAIDAKKKASAITRGPGGLRAINS